MPPMWYSVVASGLNFYAQVLMTHVTQKTHVIQICFVNDPEV